MSKFILAYKIAYINKVGTSRPSEYSKDKGPTLINTDMISEVIPGLVAGGELTKQYSYILMGEDGFYIDMNFEFLLSKLGHK